MIWSKLKMKIAYIIRKLSIVCIKTVSLSCKNKHKFTCKCRPTVTYNTLTCTFKFNEDKFYIIRVIQSRANVAHHAWASSWRSRQSASILSLRQENRWLQVLETVMRKPKYMLFNFKTNNVLFFFQMYITIHGFINRFLKNYV